MAKLRRTERLTIHFITQLEVQQAPGGTEYELISDSH